MPNGPRKWSPQLDGSKPRHLMNAIDREGLGRFVIEQSHKGLSTRKISDIILEEYKVNIGYRSIAYYLETFRDPQTGQICPLDKLPNIPTRETPKLIAQDLYEILEEQQIDDITILEHLTVDELSWFRDPENPISLKLKVAKELRETIKLKLELGGVVKPTPVQNNTLVMDSGAMEKMFSEKPEMVAMFREFLWLASGRADVPREPQLEFIEDKEIEV